MHRSKESLLPELKRLMTAHPATIRILLQQPAPHSPGAAANILHQRLSDRASAGIGRLRKIKMWVRARKSW